MNLPFYNNSSMDGFAIRSQDCSDFNQTFRVVGRSLAGESPGAFPEGRIAVEITTGAPIPIGFDVVIKVEESERVGPSEVRFNGPVEIGQHIRSSGSDFKVGDPVATSGMVMDATRVMALAALGIREIPVFKKPMVWVAATGQELVEYDAPLTDSRIRNATSPYLVQELEASGAEVRYCGLITDEGDQGSKSYRELLQAATAEGIDLLLTTGAVSMGVHDFTKNEVLSAGGEIVFHKVSIRPGKPVLVARFKDFPKTLVMGLPGNPVSSVVGMEFFVTPYLNSLFGRQESKVYRGILKNEAEKPMGFRAFYKANVCTNQNGVLEVSVLKGQSSHLISNFDQANAWAILDEAGDAVPGGTLVDVVFFKERR
jgi:molybdopterin molybdotransferase